MDLWKTETFTLTNSADCVVLCAPVNTYRVRYNTTCCLLVCSEWLPVTNPTATPISRWMVDCTACTCRTTSLTLPRPPSVTLSIQCSRSVAAPFQLACTPSIPFYFAFVLLPCFLLFHTNNAVRHHEAIAAGRVSQKLRCTKVYSRIVQCQISNFCRNRDIYGMTYVRLSMYVCIYI